MLEYSALGDKKKRKIYSLECRVSSGGSIRDETTELSTFFDREIKHYMNNKHRNIREHQFRRQGIPLCPDLRRQE